MTISPENLTPPSEITGTSPATETTSKTADNWGTPTPAIILVVQIEPGPTPTLTASAPALISALAPAAVATFPAPTSILGYSFLIKTIGNGLRITIMK